MAFYKWRLQKGSTDHVFQRLSEDPSNALFIQKKSLGIPEKTLDVLRWITTNRLVESRLF